MTQRCWVAALVLPLAALPVGVVLAQDAEPSLQPTIVGLAAVPEDGNTRIRIETTTETIGYISYSRDATTYVIDIYGHEIADVPSRLDVGSEQVRAVELETTSGEGGYSSVARIVIERATPGPNRIRIDGSTMIVDAVESSRAVVPTSGWPARGPTLGSASRGVPPSKLRTQSVGASALVIEDVWSQSIGQGLDVAIKGDGRLRYDSFTLDNPPRLVVDFLGVTNRVGRSTVAVRHPAVDRIRVAQFKTSPSKVARVVFDLGDHQDHRLVASGDEVHVYFGADALSALESGEGIQVSEAAQGSPPPPMQPMSMGADDYGTEVYGSIDDDEGTLISLDLKDADIKDVLRYFSEISGLNIILDPAVGGNVTVRLIDVPWNKALDIILKANGYGKTLDGNVLRIARVSQLTAEETAAADLRLASEEARPLVTMTRAISYGNAGEIAAIVQQTGLSSKGQIIIDQRTNTLVITEVDIPAYHDRIMNLIKKLDTPTPQVEIEARIVETSKSFSRSWGLQWGFNNRFDQTTGSTTDFSFPNSGFISGDLVQQTGGFTSALPGGGYAVNLPSSGANAAIGFHLANITDQFQLDVVLSALEDEGKGRVLSAPKITTQSNVAASIQSGANLPIQTIANNTITVQYIAANLSLNVTPQVTADQTVILEVTVNQSTPDFGVAVGTSALPPINTRQAQTTLMVPDGGTAVIGGVFQITESESQNRLPGVHKIPVLGWLFKNHSESRANNELLIFITPKIKTLS